ncbi:hypothetical protein MPER_02265, partial [Moniliophthora perniciosa FA553]
DVGCKTVANTIKGMTPEAGERMVRGPVKTFSLSC